MDEKVYLTHHQSAIMHTLSPEAWHRLFCAFALNEYCKRDWPATQQCEAALQRANKMCELLNITL